MQRTRTFEIHKSKSKRHYCLVITTTITTIPCIITCTITDVEMIK